MKKVFCFLLIIAAISSLSACGHSGPQKAGYYWHERYPYGVSTDEEREQRKNIKELTVDFLPSKMSGNVSSISIKKQYIEVSVLYSDDSVKTAPGGWAEISEAAREISSGLKGAIKVSGDRSAVLYLTDSRKILLTAKDGELLYNRFVKPERQEPREIDQEILAKIGAESIERIKASGEYDRIMSTEPSTGGGTVYVSKNGIIHSIPNCSGMENYTEMSRGEADSKGYKYCQNCW